MTVSNASPPAERGFLAKLKQRLNKGKDWIGSGVMSAFGRSIDEDMLEGLENELLLADVGIEATTWLIDELRRKAARSENADTPLRELLRGSIVELLAPLEQPLSVERAEPPFVILVVGVNGTGKTTSIGKLAHRLNREGRSVLLAAGDTFRAAAVEQLKVWGERSDSAVVSQVEGADPAAVVHDGLSAAKARRSQVVIADTAGRLHTSGSLMDELGKIVRVIRRLDPSAPHEVLLILDASQGQNALVQAIEFQRLIGVTGLVITKLDGTAKGGIVLAVARRLGLPIRYIAVGESIDDFAPFSAEAFASALVGSPAE